MQIEIEHLEFIDPTLRQVGTEFEEETGLTLTITSEFRIGDPGVHGQLPLRGIDYRMRCPIIGQVIADQINAKWSYDPARPHMKVAVLHDVGRGLHLHTQTHPNTKRR